MPRSRPLVVAAALFVLLAVAWAALPGLFAGEAR